MLGRAAFTGSEVFFPGATSAAGEFMGGAAAGAPGGGLMLGEGSGPPGAGIAGRPPGTAGPADGAGEGVKLGVGTAGAIGGLVEEGEREGTEGELGGEIAGLGAVGVGEVGVGGAGLIPAVGGVTAPGAGGFTPVGVIGDGVGPPGRVTVGAGCPGCENGDLVTLNFGVDPRGG